MSTRDGPGLTDATQWSHRQQRAVHSQAVVVRACHGHGPRGMLLAKISIAANKSPRKIDYGACAHKRREMIARGYLHLHLRRNCRCATCYASTVIALRKNKTQCTDRTSRALVITRMRCRALEYIHGTPSRQHDRRRFQHL